MLDLILNRARAAALVVTTFPLCLSSGVCDELRRWQNALRLNVGEYFGCRYTKHFTNGPYEIVYNSDFVLAVIYTFI